jgi:hypothetical protein
MGEYTIMYRKPNQNSEAVKLDVDTHQSPNVKTD